MNVLFKYLLIALGVYIGIQFLNLIASGVKTAAAINKTAVDAVKTPMRATSSVLALGAFAWDVLTGKGVAQSWQVYTGTNENIWLN